jgi:hypothetical protein
MSPTFNNWLNSFFVQEISLNSILPFNLSSVSIFAENLFIFLTIANFQLIESSKKNLSISLFQFFVYFLLASGPLQPFLLS